jgi:hypothetical protein
VEPSQAHVIASKEVKHAPLRVDKPPPKVHFAPLPIMTAKPLETTAIDVSNADTNKTIQ